MDTANIYRLNHIANLTDHCGRCDLCKTRTSAVPGIGNASARIMIVGEGPGESEDLQGTPFVGRSGKLLDQALAEAGLPRSEVFITNIVKCRPPGNRNPLPQEMDTCYPYLVEQIEIVRPEVIIILGKVSAEYILQRPVKITKENGFVTYAEGRSELDTQLFLTVLHPAYVLRNRTPKNTTAFFQAIQTSKDIAYGRTNDKISTKSN